jgi:cytochrome b6-f complex iron-sulfur subunit
MSTDTSHDIQSHGEAAQDAVTRRALLRYSALAGAMGLSGAAIAACGGGDDAATGTATESPTQTSTAAATTPEAAPTSAAAGGATGPVLTKTADVPVGSALVVDNPDGDKVIVVQASQGEFTGLSAICTHQRCTVGVAGDRLACPCHASRFSLSGEVLQGPATAPLPAVSVAVSGEDVVLT